MTPSGALALLPAWPVWLASPDHWLPNASQHFLLGALALLIYVFSTRLRREQRPPAAAIAWVLGLALLPYLFLPMYLMFGRRKLRPGGHSRRHRPGEQVHWAADLIGSFGLAPPGLCASRLHADGAQSEAALWEIIDSATRTLDVGTFLVGNDRLGHALIERLSARARAGVKVRLMIDGMGSLPLPWRFFAPLQRAGVDVAVFRPLFSWRHTEPRNLRNHRKMVVADAHWLWMGGRNLADEYFSGRKGEAAWIDLSFDLRGPAASAALHQFELDWASNRGLAPRAVTHAADVPGGTPAQYVPSGPDQSEDTVHAVLMDACFRAEQRILAVTPYFIPDDALRDAMRLAARRGVAITIVIPRRSNHRMTDFVRTRAMRELARAGVVFQVLPMMAHAKCVVLDDNLALCGSINLDPRSLLLNHEAMVAFYGPADIAWFAEWVAALAAKGQTYVPHPPRLLRDVAEGLLLTMAFQL